MAWGLGGTLTGVSTTYLGVATVRGGSNPPTNWTIQLPAGSATGDLILLQIQTYGVNASPPVPQNPTDWTQLALINNGPTLTNHRHYYGYIRRTASTTNPVVSFTGTGTAGNSGDSYVARTIAFRPGVGFDWEIDVTGTASTNASTNAIGPATGITPTTLTGGASTLVVGSFGKPNDIASTNLVTLAPTNFTANLVETTTGLDAGAVHIHRLDAPQAATGNLTVADTGNAQVGASILVSFKEVAIAPVGGSRSFAVIC
jgi:hypothetical protein